MIPGSWPYTPETYRAFTAIKNAGFTFYCCGNRHAPHVLVATYTWERYIDLINIRALHQVTAARLPRHETPDIFAPARAVWHYMGSLAPTLNALLRLPAPHHRDAPTAYYPAPLTLFIPTSEQQPLTIKPGKRT